MKLVVFGDSFPYGCIKEPYRIPREESMKINFATQLTKLDNNFTSVKNYGRPGAGNSTIFDKVLNCIDYYNKDVFYLVCWSAPSRQAYYDLMREKYVDLGIKKLPLYQQIDQDLEFAKFIGFCSSILKYHNIPFAQISSFSPLPVNNIFPTDYYENCNVIEAQYPLTNTLFDIIAGHFCTDYNVKDPELNHDKFDVKPSKLISGCLHPTEIGHEKIAEVLNPILKNYL